MTLEMKRGDLEPDLVLTAADAANVADLSGVVSWRILGKFRGQLVVDGPPDTVVVSADKHSATLTRAWQSGETAFVGQMFVEVEAMWPGNRPQTFPAEDYEVVRFTDDLG